MFPDPWSGESFRRALGWCFLLARREGVLVGYIVGTAVPPDGEILSLAVSENSRESGVGGRLLEECVARLASDGVEQLYLEVRESNAPARSFYRNRGFSEVGRRRGYYRSPPEDALVMARQVLPD